jgi:hypothetical protein
MLIERDPPSRHTGETFNGDQKRLPLTGLIKLASAPECPPRAPPTSPILDTERRGARSADLARWVVRCFSGALPRTQAEEVTHRIGVHPELLLGVEMPCAKRNRAFVCRLEVIHR